MQFDATLRKCFGLVHLAIIAVIAYLQASAVTQLVGAAIAPAAAWLARSDDARPGSAPRAPDEHATSARAILDRNPFDSLTPRPLDAPSHDAGPPGIRTCENARALIVVASSDPTESMAVVSMGTEGTTHFVRAGDALDSGKVESVEWNRVVLSSGAARCELVMFRGDRPTVAIVEPPPAPNPASVPPEIASKIRKLGPTEFDVDREAISAILEKQAQLMGMVRVVPARENGRAVGPRLFGIRPDTILGKLGFEPGDRLQSVNGFDVTNMESAVQALARLRTADHLTVQINRRGRDMNLDFNVK
jgi:general secretion pathway protein C